MAESPTKKAKKEHQPETLVTAASIWDGLRVAAEGAQWESQCKFKLAGALSRVPKKFKGAGAPKLPNDEIEKILMQREQARAREETARRQRRSARSSAPWATRPSPLSSSSASSCPC